jgi:hypothetical protein
VIVTTRRHPKEDPVGKKSFVLGAAVGYVLGARAGRARYEQIAAQASRLWGNPKVQSTVSSAKDTALDKGSSLKDSAASSSAAQKVKDKLPTGGSGGTSTTGGSGGTSTSSGTSGGSGTGTTSAPVANPVLNTPPTAIQPGSATSTTPTPPTAPGTTIPTLP